MRFLRIYMTLVKSKSLISGQYTVTSKKQVWKIIFFATSSASGGWSSQNAEQKTHFHKEKLFLNNTIIKKKIKLKNDRWARFAIVLKQGMADCKSTTSFLELLSYILTMYRTKKYPLKIKSKLNHKRRRRTQGNAQKPWFSTFVPLWFRNFVLYIENILKWTTN